MKKTFFAVAIVSFLMMFCVTGLAQAREHIVKKGECLSSIAKQYNVKWVTIYQANKEIKNFNLIYVGQKLQIPQAKASKKCFVWKKGGVNPFGDRNVVKAISLFNISEEVKAAFITAAEKGEFEAYQMTEGQELEQQIFGNYKVVDNVVVKLPEDQLEAKLFAKVDLGDEVYFLIRPAVCGNWAWWKEAKSPEPEMVPEPVPAPPEPEIIPEPVPAPPEEPMALLIPPEETPVEESKEEPCSEYNGYCKTDLIMGAGNYKNSHPDQDAAGYYYWLKARERCFIGKIGNTDYYGGVALFLAGGEGHDRNYDYEWKEGAIGPSLKFINPQKHYDGDIDAMFGKLYNQGGFGDTRVEQGGSGIYRSKQEDTIGIISAHLNYYPRRVEGKNFLPETELNAEYRHVFNAEHKHRWEDGALPPDPSDNKVYELTVDQAIYDFHFGNWRITPAVKLGVGKEFGLSQRDLASDGLINFGEIMANIKVAYKNVKFFNVGTGYKEIFGGDGDQQHPIYITLDLSQYVDDLWNWLTTKKVEPIEIKNKP
ncbi:MAG: LysM domain-containing protein [Patescibacteria group bacterium]|jgi:LysM repeat protein